MLRSWYALAFQLPWLPERMIAADGGALVRRAVRRATRRGAFDDEELDAIARPAVRVERPSLLVWGMRDPFLLPELTEGLARWVPDLRIERVDDAGHWVHRDAESRVNEVMLTFLEPG